MGPSGLLIKRKEKLSQKVFFDSKINSDRKCLPRHEASIIYKIHSVNSDGSPSSTECFIAGPMSKFAFIPWQQQFISMGVDIKPAHTGQFINHISPSFFTNINVPLDLLGIDWIKFDEMVRGKKSIQDVFSLFISFMTSLKAHSQLEIQPIPICEIINQYHQTKSITKTAQQLGMSERTLRRNFKNTTGMNLKQYFKVERYKRLKLFLKSSKTPNFTTLAHQLDYCDQSHMIHEINDLCGFTPRELHNFLMFS